MAGVLICKLKNLFYRQQTSPKNPIALEYFQEFDINTYLISNQYVEILYEYVNVTVTNVSIEDIVIVINNSCEWLDTVVINLNHVFALIVKTII